MKIRQSLYLGTLAKPSQPRGIIGWLTTILVYGMLGLVGLMGALAFPAGIRLMFSGEAPLIAAIAATLMGAVCLALPLCIVYAHLIAGPRRDAERARIMARYPGQPWMLRKDWASRRVTHSSLGVAVFMWIWVTGWWGAIALIWSVNREKILAAAAKSWGEAAVGIIFVLAGLAGLMVAVYVTKHWWRFGRSTLRIDTLPGYFGDRFRGAITGGLSARPSRDANVKIACQEVTWVTKIGSKGRSRETRVAILRSYDHDLAASRVQLSRGVATFPIDIALPSDGPESEINDDGSGIRWVLSISAPDAEGKMYTADFEVPVYARQ